MTRKHAELERELIEDLLPDNYAIFNVRHFTPLSKCCDLGHAAQHFGCTYLCCCFNIWINYRLNERLNH